MDGSTALGAATISSNGAWTFSTTLASGAHALQAVATDSAGGTGHSALAAPITVGLNSLSAAKDTLVLNLSEDAYNGDAQFTVSVDGKALGPAQSVTALHSAGQHELFTYTGDWGAGAHKVTISYANDAYGGSSTTDRNLYVNAITLDGATTTENAAQWANGAVTYTVNSPGVAGPAVSVTSQVLVQDTGASNTDGVTAYGAVTLTGKVGGPSGTTVSVVDGAAVLGQATIDGSGGWTFSTILTSGSHALHAVASDLEGDTAASAVQSAIVVQPLPVAVIQSVSQDPNSQAVTLTGDVTSGTATQVLIYNGQTLLGQAGLDGSVNW
jgi:hypothetical protein